MKVKEYRTFAELLAAHGKGQGCEICKPAVASILASLWNEAVLEKDRATLQDTNDRFLAKHPAGRAVFGRPARAGRRDHAGQAHRPGTDRQVLRALHQDHWRPAGRPVRSPGPGPAGHLGRAGRSGASKAATPTARAPADGEKLRRHDVVPLWRGAIRSVFAIRIENRYKGLRSPHKLKAAVSGCIRECAEAQGKDFGLIATEKGYNLYVCGNGGSKPRHADLLAADLDEDTCLRYIDRFLMYYVMTADRLTRTSVWLEKAGRRHRAAPCGGHRRQAGDRRRARGDDAARRRHLPLRMEGRRRTTPKNRNSSGSS